MVFKTGNNFTLDYITDPYLAERCLFVNVAPITVTAGKYMFFNKWNN
jgi:hypothetical protein